jgi:hypothetical protein
MELFTPSCTSLFYKQLMEVFPDAKVLLSVRDPEAWYESILNTVYTVSKGGLSAPEQSTHGRLGRMINSVAWQKLFHGRFEDKAYAISIFEQHNQEVKDYVQADRLLVWDVKEGWEPLCRFLDIAVPTTPFPHLNDMQTFRQRLLANR